MSRAKIRKEPWKGGSQANRGVKLLPVEKKVAAACLNFWPRRHLSWPAHLAYRTVNTVAHPLSPTTIKHPHAYLTPHPNHSDQ